MSAAGATLPWGPKGPIAEKRDHVVLFGRVDGQNRGENPIDPPLERVDPLFWLRDDNRENPEVLAHLQLEEDHFQHKTSHLSPLINSIYDEHMTHLVETDFTVPYRLGDYFWYTRTVLGSSFALTCRRRATTDSFSAAALSKHLEELHGDNPPEDYVQEHSKEEIVLDVNAVAAEAKQCDVQLITPSPDQSLLAFCRDYSGDETYELVVIPISEAAGAYPLEHVIDTVPEVSGSSSFSGGPHTSLAWGSNEVLFYITRDDALRTFRVWRHRIGDPVSEDLLLFEEEDTSFEVSLFKTMEGNHLVIETASDTTSETILIDLRSAMADGSATKAQLAAVEKVVIRPRERNIRYTVGGTRGNWIYIVANDKGPNFRVVAAPLSNPGRWDNTVVDHRFDTMLQGLYVFEKFAVLTGRYDGLTQVWILTRVFGGHFVDPMSLVRLASQDEIYAVGTGYNPTYCAPFVQLRYCSMRCPPRYIEYYPGTENQTIVHQLKVPEYDPDEYVCERHVATAPDSERIYISTIRRKDCDGSTTRPCLLYAYGAYGVCIEPKWDRYIIPYIKRGFVYAIAHVRGGGEMGREWYEIGGKYLTKRNTFTDFIACAEHLIEWGITEPSKLVCEGRSAGGLLVAAVVNMRPDLWRVGVATVPFVDVMSSMADATMPLTCGEWEVWGNPNEWQYHDYMLSYSPYDNVRRQPYPHMYVSAGLHDPRVAYWEPTKWVSKLRELKTSDTDVVYRCDFHSGHFSRADRYRYWWERSHEQGFVLGKILPECLSSAIDDLAAGRGPSLFYEERKLSPCNSPVTSRP